VNILSQGAEGSMQRHRNWT